MNRLAVLLYSVAYCLACAAIWLVIGGIAGALVSASLIQEEARGPMTGFVYGAPLGTLLGLVLGVLATRRRARRPLKTEAAI